MDLYRENILDHYQNPRNFGKLPKPTTSAQVFNDFCGDFIHMDIKLKKPKSSTKINVEDVRFEGSGCAISLASASILTEYIRGKTINQLQELSANDTVKLIGIELTPVRLKCALLAWEVLHKAINKIYG